MKNMKPISLAIATMCLAGCAATQQAEQRYTDTQKSTDVKFQSSYVKSSAAAVAKDDANKAANFSRSEKNWINPIPLPRVEEKAALPEVFSKNVSMTMPGTVNAVEILSEMQRASGITFQLAQDVYDTTPGQAKLIGPGGTASTSSKASPLLISDFVFRGSLENALNLFSAKSNLSWKWNGRGVEIFRFETKTYNIAALAGATRSSSTVSLKGDTGGSAASSGTGGAANSGNSSSSVNRQASLTTWDEVTSFLISQLSPSGSLAVLESTGAVTVKDIPVVHQRIEKSINDLNALLSKQVYLNVDIYAVSATNADNGGVDWNLVWSGNRNSLGFNTTVGQTASAKSNFSIGVLTGPFTGTKVILNALSTLGRASVINQFSVTTLNGQPTPIASNRKIGYLASVKVTQGSQGQPPTYELTPGEISAGVNLNVTPKIEPNGNILLEYAMNLSDVEDIRQLTAPDGSSTIELPSSNLKSVLQRATLRSGQTLVLSGFKQTNSKTNKSGVGTPSNMLLGGKHDASVDDQYLVIAVTPYIANSNAYSK